MQRNHRPWFTLFSQSGNEIFNIIKETGITPDAIFTNNPNCFETELGRKYSRLFRYKTKWAAVDYIDVLGATHTQPIITLHGWLKIIPEIICENYEIYNGHPALVNHYPELKGKDMQDTVINEVEKYPIIGSIIHKVIPEVDAGEILKTIEVPNFKVHNRDVIYQVLKDTSLQSWLEFLPTILC